MIDVINEFVFRLQDGGQIFRAESVDKLTRRALDLRADNTRLTAELDALKSSTTTSTWVEGDMLVCQKVTRTPIKKVSE